MNSIRLNKANNEGVIDNTLNGKSIPQNNRIILMSVLIISVRKQKAIKALRVLMGTAVFKRSSLQIGRFLV